MPPGEEEAEMMLQRGLKMEREAAKSEASSYTFWPRTAPDALQAEKIVLRGLKEESALEERAEGWQRVRTVA
jgi:hypothetical protein